MEVFAMKQRITSTVILLTTLILVLVTFTACSKNTENFEPSTITSTSSELAKQSTTSTVSNAPESSTVTSTVSESTKQSEVTSTVVETPDEANVENPDEAINLDNFIISVDSEENLLTEYRKEVKKRFQDSDFYTTEELRVLRNMGYEKSSSGFNGNENFLLPVEISGKQKICFTKDDGTVTCDTENIGNLNYDNDTGFLPIISPAFAFFYNENAGIVELKSFNETIDSIKTNGTYGGISSAKIGVLFLDEEGNLSATYLSVPITPHSYSLESNIIARGVDSILYTDYPYDHRYNWQPLLKMQDGAVKAYIGDNVSGILCDPIYTFN